MSYTLIFAKISKNDSEGKEVYTQFIPQNLQQEKFGVSAMTKGLKFRMLPVEDFCEKLDIEKVKQTDLLAMFKENDSMSTFKKKYDELSTSLKQQY